MPTATRLTHAEFIQFTLAPLLAQLYTPILQSLLGNREALARKNARSDRVFLDFLVTFFINVVRNNV